MSGNGARSGRRGPAGRRGVAMLLVLVAVTAATVLAGAVLMSQDNAPAIGQNAGSAASAGWSAESAANMATAMVEQNMDAIVADSDGEFMGSMAMGDADVSVRVTDLEGNKPDGDERELLVTSRAEVNGIEIERRRVVPVPVETDVEDAIDPELKEFGLFAVNDLRLSESSKVKAWWLSPGYVSGGGVSLGVGFDSSSGLSVHSGATVSNGALFAPPGATSSMRDEVENNAKFGGRGRVLPVQPPVYDHVLPSSLASLSGPGTCVIVEYGAQASIPAGRYQVLTIDSGGEAALSGDYVFTDDVTVGYRGVLRVSGDTRVYVVDDSVIADEASVVLEDGATLRWYVGDDLLIHDAGVGVPLDVAQSSPRDPESIKAYEPSTRVRFYGVAEVSGGDGDQTIALRGYSLVKAVICAPRATVVVDDATLIGCVVGGDVRMESQSALIYDLGLDPGTGLTATEGPLYHDDGSAIENLGKALASFNWTMGLDAFVTHMESYDLVASGLGAVPVTVYIPPVMEKEGDSNTTEILGVVELKL